MSQFAVYARLTKVDEATRRVTGVIASEAIDRANEVFDYDSSKPHFEKWSSDIAKATEGKSVGNVRAMHGNIAAGILTDIEFDDVAKTITVTSEVVDDNEWNKVRKGCYTGFSIGGKYVRKWDCSVNKGAKRYTANPSEVSLVDLPCNKTATFTMCKADGMTVEEHFDESVTKADDASTDDAETLAKADTTTDDTTPEDGELRIENGVVQKFEGGAWNDIAKVGAGIGGDEDGEELQKGAYAIATLAHLADDVAQFCNYRRFESWDGDSTKPIPAELKVAAIALYDALIRVVNEDAEKAKSMVAAKLAKMAEEGDDLRKQHDAIAALQEPLEALRKALEVDDFGKVVEAITKVAEDNAALRKNYDELKAKWDASPAAGKGQLRSVEKSAEADLIGGSGNEGTTATASVDASPEDAFKTALTGALRKGTTVRDLGSVRQQ